MNTTKKSRRNMLLALAILAGSMTAGVAQAQHTSTSRNKGETTTTPTKSGNTSTKKGKTSTSSSSSGIRTYTESSVKTTTKTTTYSFNGHGPNDAPAFVFYDNPMGLVTGTSRETTYKEVQKFLKKQYPKIKRDEKKNDYIKMSPSQGYYMSYCGIVPDYIQTNFVNKKIHSYSYYYVFSKQEYKEHDVKSFVKKMQYELDGRGVKMKEVAPDGHNSYRATHEGDKNVALTYEDLGQYYGVQLWVSY